MRQTTTRKLLATLARRMKEHRQTLGLSQEALAERSGLSSNFIARIEIGGKTPSLSTLAKLADALGTTVSDLLDDKKQHETRSISDYISQLLSRLDEPNREFAREHFQELVEHLARMAKSSRE